MKPTGLERAVALATGETIQEIRRRGFGLADSCEVAFDPEPCDLTPQLVNWDELERLRLSLFP
jgi:hypothetical protein